MSNSIHFTPNPPKYNSMKRAKNNTFIKKESSLTRQRSMTGYSMHKSYNAYDKKENEIDSKHENCLNWLKAGNSYEKESKELDANIQLLMWKKRHLEILQKQKTKEPQPDRCGKLQDSSTASDSPPPLSDFFKPELSSVSADDGFESAVGAVNNQVNLQHISYLESELKRRDLRIEMYEELMSTKNLRNNLTEDPTQPVSSRHSTSNNNNYTCLQDLRSSPKTSVLSSSRSFFSNQPLNDYRTSTPEAKTAVRPNSFKTDLLSSHHSNTLPHSNIKSSQSFHHFSHNSYQQNLNNSFLTPQSHRIFPQSSREGRVGVSSMELLKVKSELLVKDQDLRKMRNVLKELSGRYNELLEQHMKLLQSQQNSRRSQLTSPNALKQDDHPYVANSRLEQPYVRNNGRQETPARNDLREELVELLDVLKHQRHSSPFPETPSKLQERSGRWSSNNKDISLLLHTFKQLRTNIHPGSNTSPHHDNDLEYYLRPQ